MSKETLLILLGLFVMALRTLLGFPGTWQTAMLILAGGAVAMIGFLLRGEALARGPRHTPHDSFVESNPASVNGHHSHQDLVNGAHSHHEKERISSLN